MDDRGKWNKEILVCSICYKVDRPTVVLQYVIVCVDHAREFLTKFEKDKDL